MQDGRLPEKDLVDFQKQRALRELPGLLDYAGYVLFFPSLFAGPSFDFVDYRQWIETSMFDLPPGTDPKIAPRTRKQRRIPRSGTPATWKAVTGLAWILAFLQFSTWYNVGLVLSKQYMEYGFLRRVWQLEMFGFVMRMKYYGVWYLTEGACILSGMGFKGVDPKTGKVYWNRLQNVNPWGIETAQNSRGYIENWNMNTNNWLRNYMYLRVTPKGKKPGFRASLATFTTSAIWHGFYPGYYLTFVLGAFVQTIAKSESHVALLSPLPPIPFPFPHEFNLRKPLNSTDVRGYIRPFFFTPDGTQPTPYKPYYDFLSYLATQLAFAFTAAPFVLLSLQDSLLVWSRVYFYTIIGAAAAMAFFASPAKSSLIQRLSRRNNSNKQKMQGGTSSDMDRTEKEERSHPLQGIPSDFTTEVNEAVEEIRRRGGGKGV